MSTECYPTSVLPHITQLYRDYLAMVDDSPVQKWYGASPFNAGWMGRAPSPRRADALADALYAQNTAFNAGPLALANIEKLRNGAHAVVTGQQVGLFGGPLLTLHKVATAVARAAEATAATGIDHVPVFWLATEDHDLAEVNTVSLLTKTSLEEVTAALYTSLPVPVGGVVLGDTVQAALDRASELLAYAPVCDQLREFYAPGATLGGAFARLIAHLFRAHGLIVIDAAARDFHALGSSTLRAAIDDAAGLESALLSRSSELGHDGYHAQVLVKPGSSLLFLVDAHSGERMALRRIAGGIWKAGNTTFFTSDLHGILDAAPERISPNALLRPIFQDTILPTAAYIGGPAEVAYFAQSEVLYQKILQRTTPILPRLSATLIEPAFGELLAKHELSLPDTFTTPEHLAQRLGARAMPIATKRKLAAVGNAMETELTALTEHLAGMDASLGRAAKVSGSKMLYQMNRLRRMAATFELQKQATLRRQADTLTLNLFPNAHPQERILAGIWFVARHGEGLIDRLVTEARNLCPGHVVIRL